MVYIIVLCIGGSGIEEYKLRKELVSNNILFKRLNKKMKFYLSKTVNKDLLQGNIGLLLNNNNLNDVLKSIENLKKYKNYVVLGVLFKECLFSIEFLNEIKFKMNMVNEIINKNIFNIYMLNIKNNLILLKNIKNVNNKSSN